MNIALQGIIPPLLTPLSAQDMLDIVGLERLIEHVIAGGVHGIFILGTTGEAPGLSYRLREEVIRESCRLVRGRVPVLVGVTDTAYSESVRLAGAAADAGAAAVVVAQPYYFPAGQPELLEYLQHLAPMLPLPVVLYNMPSMTKLYYDVDTVRQALEIPNIVGLKDSSGNMVYFQRLLAECRKGGEFSLLMGPEELLAESVLFGGDGGVCGGANLFPRLYVRLWQAAAAGDLAEVRLLQRQVMRVCSALYGIGHYGSSYLKGVKATAAAMGLCQSFLSEPFHQFKEQEQRVVRERLEMLRAEGIA